MIMYNTVAIKGHMRKLKSYPKTYVKTLKRAKHILDHTGLGDSRSQFICCCINDCGVGEAASNATRKMVMRRLGDHPSILEWILTHPGFTSDDKRLLTTDWSVLQQYRHKWIDSMIEEFTLYGDYVSALTAAKEYLSDSHDYDSRDKSEFICIAIRMAMNRKKITANQSHSTIALVNRLLDGHTTMSGWLKSQVPGIDTNERCGATLQAHRLAWIEKLIEYYSSPW